MIARRCGGERRVGLVGMRDVRVRPDRWDAAVVGYAMVFAAWEATAALWGNDAAHPTLSLLVDPVLATYPGRVAGWIAWLGVGRWLVTR
jgi:hypothetical protein